MQLYIVRHAYAGQHGDPEYPNDDLRPVTRKGRKRFSRLVKRLSRQEFAPALVGTSPLVRCRQTADVIARQVGSAPQIVEIEALQPGSDLDSLVSWSNEQQVEELAWVGHAPDVDELASALLGARSGAIRLAKGAVASLRFDGEIARDKGELCWLVVPKRGG